MKVWNMKCTNLLTPLTESVGKTRIHQHEHQLFLKQKVWTLLIQDIFAWLSLLSLVEFFSQQQWPAYLKILLL